MALVTIRDVFIQDIPTLWETYDPRQSIVQQFSQPVVINSIAWSPDGRYLATGSGDKRVRVYDTETKELKVIGDLNGEVSSVSWSPDGSLLAAASLVVQLSATQADDRQIVAWSFPDGAEVKALNVHGFYMANSLSFSPDGRVLASAGDEGAVVYVDTASWEVLDRYQFNYSGINPRGVTMWELAFFPHRLEPACGCPIRRSGGVDHDQSNPVYGSDVVSDLGGGH
jgi:dipeptidyl aminopeptidase/acylaminoacyl peptidase